MGPGTGRYLEKGLDHCVYETYEIHETATPWRQYLEEKYPVKSRISDGYSPTQTRRASVGLAHAHKVSTSVPFIVTGCYWNEFARVIRPGGWAVLDIMTERCLEQDGVQVWVNSGIRNGAYPAVMPRNLPIDYFTRRGFSLVDSTMIDMPPGRTEVMAFRRET